MVVDLPLSDVVRISEEAPASVSVLVRDGSTIAWDFVRTSAETKQLTEQLRQRISP
jgi:hypothetical protein